MEDTNKIDILYKYYSVSEISKRLLNEQKVSFTPIELLNDPFEGTGDFFWELLNNINNGGVSCTYSDIYKDIFSFINRVLCLTSTNNNPVMWAHYAKNYSGFCVGYLKSDIEKVAYKLNKISYAEMPPKCNLDKIDTYDDVDGLALNLLYSKEQSWQAEKEWRGIYKLKDDDKLILKLKDLNIFNLFNSIFPYQTYESKKFDNSKYSYLYYGTIKNGDCQLFISRKYIELPCKIQTIYLGINMNKQDENEICNICLNNGIEIYKMIKKENTYDMLYKKFS